MQLRIDPSRRRYMKPAIILLAALALILLLRQPLAQVAGLALGAAVIAFLSEPLARVYERKLSRPLAALACLVSIGLALALLLWLLLPAMLREIIELARALPQSIEQISNWFNQAIAWLEERLPGLSLTQPDFGGIGGALSGIATGTIAVAGNIADTAGQLSLMVILAYFFLCDRENLMLRLELLTPQSFRPTAVRMGNAVCRELRLYLRGQLMIALAVAVLAGAGLLVIGVRSALVLGPIIGIMNMIPYFGPFIGGIPAVLIALGDGWQKAALTVLVLTIVQQLDGSLISPRIMGNLTGFSPALVLVGIFAGARIAGIAGMLFALPVMLIIRTLYRVFVQRSEKTDENI